MYQLNDNYLRPKKAQWLRRMYATPFEKRENLRVWQGEHATVLPLRPIPGEGVLFPAASQARCESSSGRWRSACHDPSGR